MENRKIENEKILEKYADGMRETREILKRLCEKGELPPVRSLTRGERRKMDEAGVNIRGLNYTEMGYAAKVEALSDWILDNIFGEFDFDSIPNNVGYVFAMRAYELTYSDRIAEKN